MKWRRSPATLWRSTPGWLVLGDVDGTTIDVSGPGEAVWQLLTAEPDDDELVRQLAEMFDGEAEAIRGDVQAMLDRLEAEGHVERVA